MNQLSGSEKDVLRKKFGHNRLSGSEMDSGRKAKSKALESAKRYQAAKMPPEGSTHEERVEHYKKNKGKLVSNETNPKTGKYLNTY